MRVRSVATRAQFPELLLARIQTLTMRDSFRNGATLFNRRLGQTSTEVQGYVSERASRTMELAMKARVYVSMKPTVLDPQGQTIRSALAGLGHSSIASVRQGKYFEIVFDHGTDREKAAAEIEQIAHDVLANPVIEEYRIEIGE